MAAVEGNKDTLLSPAIPRTDSWETILTGNDRRSA
jgi:hypothetical protein